MPSTKTTPPEEVRYSADLATLICERIATIPQSMAKLCQDPDLPSVASVFRWLRDHEDFRDMYVLAKQCQAEILIDEALDIIDDASNDLMVDAQGRTVINRAALQRAKMRVAFRQWIASKLLPRKYGNARSAPPAPPSPPPAPAEPQPAPGGGHIVTLEMQLAAQERRRKYLEAHKKAMLWDALQQQQAASTPPPPAP